MSRIEAVKKEAEISKTTWEDRHNYAIRYPRKSEKAILDLLKAWKQYAEIYSETYPDYNGIGNDGYAADCWESMARNIRSLLSMECGRLDCGTLDHFILQTMKENGSDISQL
jgi:hypothetical protein